MKSRTWIQLMGLIAACVFSMSYSLRVSASLMLDTLSTMTENSWARINVNEFWESWTPLQLRPTPDSPATNISGWSGAAWDPTRNNMYIWGGDIGNEQGNEVYIFDADTGLWDRGSLPSQITGDTWATMETMDGWEYTPVSGESWDNVVFLENSDRLAAMGVSREGQTFRNVDDQTGTGPYFWDPSKADPDKVSGADGTGVDPTTEGGYMWENRDNWPVALDQALRGVTAYAEIDGKDTVFFATSIGSAWKYTVEDINDPSSDTWDRLGRRTQTGDVNCGAGTYDPVRNAFVVTSATTNHLMYWDVGAADIDNRAILVEPTIVGLDPATDTAAFEYMGLEYDPYLDLYIAWTGAGDLWFIEPPDILGPDGWIATQVLPTGTAPSLDGIGFTGVFGKWMYLAEEQAYMGVIDPIAGDVFLYKPDYGTTSGGNNPAPVPATVWLLVGGGLLGMSLYQRQRRGR